MRVLTKEEILKLDYPVLLREWQPTAYDDEGWLLTCGRDCTGHAFGAINLDPDPQGNANEEVMETWDWDGPLDLDDDKLYVVAEKKDVENMKARLQLCLDKCNFDNLKEIGKETYEV